ncbi:hypothetical protein HMPREF3038_03087 [Akkermansia sp. KLE1797]|nr:hypothetical protein HMPREF3038_03087 [Akkermansia sp. KLE1797]
MRGLKLPARSYSQAGRKVAPSRVRGLKPNHSHASGVRGSVAPSRVRGLKQAATYAPRPEWSRTLTGAWIETAPHEGVENS